MILPQELEVFYVIPAIRRELALALKSGGLSQKKIAGIFGVTEACVSNYFKSKRANDVKFSPELKLMINDCAKSISAGKSCFISSIEKVCREFKNAKCLCDLHKKIDNHLCCSFNCGGCFA